jgi:hypothetical protein
MHNMINESERDTDGPFDDLYELEGPLTMPCQLSLLTSSSCIRKFVTKILIGNNKTIQLSTCGSKGNQSMSHVDLVKFLKF